ncbi:MAG TPA: serine hydrolase [Pyrinomonadaceae bacterium]
MAAALLARQDRLSLDDNVRKYVPELPDYRPPVTLRHLAHHTGN